MKKNLKTKVGLVAAMSLLSLGLVTSSAFAKSTDNSRPGWGFGDDHHVHTGPPGRSISVNPGHGHDDGDKDEDDQGSDKGHHHFFDFNGWFRMNFWNFWKHQN